MESLHADDLAIRVKNEGVDFRTKVAGDLTVSWVTLAKGVDLSPATVGLHDDLCQCPHWGFVIKGAVRMKTTTGSKDFRAGEAFYWEPGHVPEALE